MSKKNEEKNIVKLVRKSNQLVEAKYKFDIWETRVFTKMLTMVRKDDADFQTYRIYLKDVINEFELANNNAAYKRLKSGARKLMSKMVKIVRETDEGIMELETPIVVGIDKLISPNSKVEDARFIDISFHPGMKPFLLSLQSHFTTYDVRNILKLPSSYSIRIYELLKQYQKIGRRKFQLTELKLIIGVIEEISINHDSTEYKDNYPLYGNFRQRVLEKAKRDLKKYTDIKFDYEPIKRGRAVYEIIFYIHENRQTPTKHISRSNIINPINSITAEIHDSVKEWVNIATVSSWLKQYPEQQIRRAINYTMNQIRLGKKIPNVGGYLQRMVKEENLIDPTEKSKKKRLQQEERKKLKALLQEEEKVLRRELYNQELFIIKDLFEENATIKIAALKAAKESKYKTYDHHLSDEENYETKVSFRASVNNKVKLLYPAKFEELQKSYEHRINEVKLKISKL